MKLSATPLLACPAPLKAAVCGGSLAVNENPPFPARTAGDDPEELLDGALTCLACRTEFPVLSGEAVLTPQPGDYLRKYYRSVTRDLDRYGRISQEARIWLDRRFGRDPGSEEYGADFRFSQQFEHPWDVARAMTKDPGELYGTFGEWLKGVETPYDVLAAWTLGSSRGQGLALDSGCGGGGLVSRLASGFAQVFGVDLSFLAVLLARRTLLHVPEAERSYYLSARRGYEIERPLNVKPRRNVEFVVADCSRLPFPPQLFDAVSSSNVIDIAGIDRPLDEAARVLRGGGVFALSNPFFFRDGEAPQGEPREVVRTALAERGLLPEVERDGVPWAWVTYDRHWRLYFNYCVAARKEPAAE
jgi:SAM-dependent methyltransferase